MPEGVSSASAVNLNFVDMLRFGLDSESVILTRLQYMYRHI